MANTEFFQRLEDWRKKTGRDSYGRVMRKARSPRMPVQAKPPRQKPITLPRIELINLNVVERIFRQAIENSSTLGSPMLFADVLAIIGAYRELTEQANQCSTPT